MRREISSAVFLCLIDVLLLVLLLVAIVLVMAVLVLVEVGGVKE